MSTNTNLQVPAHIAARIAARTGQKSAILQTLLGEGFSYPKISTRASRYRLVEDGVETVVGTTMDAIIVGSNPHVSKIYYSKPYDGATDVRPDCWSNDGITPDASIAAPVHPNCAACPHNVLGSKVTPTGAKSKTCADQRHLAVVPAADPSKVYGFTVTVSAFKGLREYMKDLDNYGLWPQEVVTELGFDEQASYPKVTFSRKGTGSFVPEKAMTLIEEICASAEVKTATRQDTTGAARLAAPATAPKEQIAAPAAVKPAVVAAATAPAAVKPAVVAAVAPAKKPEDNTAPEPSALSAMESKLSALFAD